MITLIHGLTHHVRPGSDGWVATFYIYEHGVAISHEYWVETAPGMIPRVRPEVRMLPGGTFRVRLTPLW